MPKADMLAITRIIGTAGRTVSMYPKEIKRAVEWAKENYANLEVDELGEMMVPIFEEYYRQFVTEKFDDKNPSVSGFFYTHPPKLTPEMKIDIVHSALAAIAMQRADIHTYGEYIRDFDAEAVLFELPGTSAAYLDAADDFLNKVFTYSLSTMLSKFL